MESFKTCRYMEKAKMLDLPTLYTTIKIYIVYALAVHWK